VDKIYCDTSTLFHNIKRHEHEPKTRNELLALQQLLTLKSSGKIEMFRSNVMLREVEKTQDAAQLGKLMQDYELLQQIPRDEKYYGTSLDITDPHGGSIQNPLVSDVQDDSLCAELVARKLERIDAQHITQAFCSSCDIFLTRDDKTIINPRCANLARLSSGCSRSGRTDD
jgi:hypothetical protein